VAGPSYNTIFIRCNRYQFGQSSIRIVFAHLFFSYFLNYNIWVPTSGVDWPTSCFYIYRSSCRELLEGHNKSHYEKIGHPAIRASPPPTYTRIIVIVILLLLMHIVLLNYHLCFRYFVKHRHYIVERHIKCVRTYYDSCYKHMSEFMRNVFLVYAPPTESAETLCDKNRPYKKG